MKFSIITCTYNSEKYVQKNIDSVKNQTFQDFEHIFIDGFSTDGTIAMIEEYQKKFPDKVKLFQFEPKGIANAMNKGIELSSGEYINHLHSDDSFYGNSILQSVINFIEEKNKPDWIYGKINVMEDSDRSIGIFPEIKLFQLGKNLFTNYLLKFFNFIPHQSVFIKKTTLEKFNYFDETITSSMDYDLWIKMRDKTTWFFIDRIISNYRIRPNAQSSGRKNQKENRKNLAIVQKRYFNFLGVIVAETFNKFIDKINKTKR